MAALLAATAVLLAATGGFRATVGGLRLSARSPLLVAILAAINFSIWLTRARRANAVESDLDAIWNACNRHAKPVIVSVALIASLVATIYSTRSAAGADASGYVSEAALLASTQLFHVDDLSDMTRGHDAYLTTPLGWQPSPAVGKQSPTYAPGLPLLMAVPHAVGGVTGATHVVIAAAIVAVIATGLIASHLGGSVSGILAAMLIAFTPVFLYQSIQPMSDVPVTAAWLVCFLMLCRSDPSGSLIGGVACGLAVLIRPNLAPLAIVPLFIARRRIAFAVPVAVAGVALAYLQWRWYGSPLRSGYGATETLFSAANIIPNIGRYADWWLSTAPVLLIGWLFGPTQLRSNPFARALAAFDMLVIAAYLIYAVFDEWSYLRFLLPALAVSAVFTGVVLAKWIESWPVAVRVALLFAVAIGLTGLNVWSARSLDTFKLADQLRRVSTVAGYLQSNVPPSAVLLSGEQSGSMRYYTGRSILRWEAASTDALATVLPTLENSNRPLFIVLDAWEEGSFRSKLSAVVPLDWPPMLEAGTTHRTRVWRLDDRARYLRGEPVDTVRLR